MEGREGFFWMGGCSSAVVRELEREGREREKEERGRKRLTPSLGPGEPVGGGGKRRVVQPGEKKRKEKEEERKTEGKGIFDVVPALIRGVEEGIPQGVEP